MSQLHFIRKRRPGKHLSYSDRQLIEYVHWNNLKKPQRERKSQKGLAEELGISPATLSRELRRGYVLQQRSDLTEYYRYSAEVAQRDYDLKASRKGPDLKIGHDHELAQTLETEIQRRAGTSKLRCSNSPYAVIQRLESKGWPTNTRISVRTLYNYIARDVFFAITQKDLPRKGKSGKGRRRRVRRRHIVTTGRQIEDRPIEASERSEPGHWEMDCIESVKGDRTCLLSLVDRYSREGIILKLTSQTQAAVIRALNGLERKWGAAQFRHRFKSITVDNGAEFWDWEGLETSILSKEPRTTIYYAHPYSSWERGSNENLNGFIRYYIPKGTPLKQFTRSDLRELQDYINEYPRKILGGLSVVEFLKVA